MHWGQEQRAKARALSRVHDAVLGGGPGGFAPRRLISDSWRRSLAAQVDPFQHEAPIVLGPDEVADRWAGHPLSTVLPVLRETLVGIAEDAMHVMIITDADGHVLWAEGERKVRRSAEDVHLAEGARWTEDAIGTNAMGIALAVDTPVVVHSAEHLVRTYHGWTCAASPVHDPDSGATIGAVDISGPLNIMHPAVGALVTAAARLAENELKLRQAARDALLRSRNMRHLIGLHGEAGALLSPTGRVLVEEPYGLLPPRVDVTSGRIALGDGREGVVEPLAEGYLLRIAKPSGQRQPLVSLTFLGVEHPVAVLNGRELALTSRHAELLTALVLHPHGLTAEQLALKLYGDRGNPATVRAELHRLRAQVGTGTLLTKPYRLRADVQGDFVAVREALRCGDVDAAAAGYRGALLPRSEAPVVREEREDLLAGVRRVVLALGDADHLWEFTRTDGGHDDVEALRRLARALPRDDVRHEFVAGQLRRALVDG
jgi:hypothetical protein